jgi:hypothetical protein
VQVPSAGCEGAFAAIGALRRNRPEDPRYFWRATVDITRSSDSTGCGSERPAQHLECAAAADLPQLRQNAYGLLNDDTAGQRHL